MGVNQFDEKEDIEPNILEIDENKVKKQVESLIILKESRNNDQVKNKLTQLKTIAQTNDNIMPSLISCAINDCTLGEISDTLRNVFGEHQDH